MKHLLLAILSIFIFSCTSDNQDIQDPDNPDGNENNNPSNVITASDFTTSIEENPIENFNIGVISATSEMTLTYTLISQSPENSISVITSYGLLKVADNTIFDYETNPTITGIVKVSNASNSVNINITINLEDIYECDTNNLNFTENSTNTTFSNRYHHKIIFFNGKYWSYGGAYSANSGDERKEIWSSVDGINWSLEVPTSDIGYLTEKVAVVFNNKVWLIGKGTGYSTEIWQSSDAKNFTLLTINNSTFNNYGRSNHQLIVYNNTLYLIGGKLDGIYPTGVMSTTDGINWNSISTNNPFSPGRKNHVSLIFDNKIWIIGGDNGNEDYNDAWSSTDGINWNLEIEDGFRYSKRSGHEVIVYNNKLWLWGGIQNLGYAGYHSYGDLWSSCNGKRWIQVDNLVAPYNLEIPYEVTGAETIVNNNQIISIGGYNGSSVEPIWIFNE